MGRSDGKSTTSLARTKLGGERARTRYRFLFMPAILRHDGTPSCFYGHPSGHVVQPSFSSACRCESPAVSSSKPVFAPFFAEIRVHSSLPLHWKPTLFYSAPITFQTRPNRRHCSRLTREFSKFTLLKGRRDEGLVCNSRDFGTDVNNFLEYYSVIFRRVLVDPRDTFRSTKM